MNAGDLREYAVRPALKMIDLWSVVAEDLVMGTAAQESRFQYLEQLRGPAIGLFQMEPATFQHLWKNVIPRYPRIMRGLQGMTVNSPAPTEMAWNLRFAAAMCRVHYYAKPDPLPLTSDPRELGLYWKRHYNTFLGKGTVDEFVDNYKRYVLGKSDVD
jgi:hypothetical protein